MKRKLVLAMGIILAFSSTNMVFAGEWKQESNQRWWYQNDDGSYTTNNWQQIDGKYYYFDADGYMLVDTTTPDGYKVAADGSWIQNTNGPAQQAKRLSNITYAAGSVTDALTISDWTYVPEYSNSTQHIFEITNNSSVTLKISINDTAKNRSGDVIGANSSSQEDIPAGCTVFVMNYFSNVTGVDSYDTVITTKEENFYIPVIQNIAVDVKDRNDKVIVTATNNGTQAAEFVEATAVFFDGDTVSYSSSAYLDNDEFYLTPGASMTKQINTLYSTGYDSVKVHITGRRSKYSTK